MYLATFSHIIFPKEVAFRCYNIFMNFLGQGMFPGLKGEFAPAKSGVFGQTLGAIVHMAEWTINRLGSGIVVNVQKTPLYIPGVGSGEPTGLGETGPKVDTRTTILFTPDQKL